MKNIVKIKQRLKTQKHAANKNEFYIYDVKYLFQHMCMLPVVRILHAVRKSKCYSSSMLW